MAQLARDPKQLGSILRRARKRLKWSQADLAEKTGLRQATISLIENGHSAAKLETLLSVLAALDLEFQIAPRTKGAEMDIAALFHGP
jgi:HTH-type transcriptional regulator / antitoxin HipB